MKAWVLENIGKIDYKDVVNPIAGDDETIVRVRAAGICGSDIPRTYQTGAHNMPLIIGHEFAGEIIEKDEKSNPISTKRVGIFPLIPCKQCPSCLKKKYEMCSSYNYLGSRCNGGFAEYVSVPKWNLIELPENVTFEQAAMLEPMAVSVHAIRKSGIGENLSENDGRISSVIWGAGTIGLLIAMFLLDMGMTSVYVVCNHEYQKEYAIKIGVKKENVFCTDNAGLKAEDWLMKQTKNIGPDAFFECVGKAELFEKAINIVAPGGTVVTVGNPYSDVELPKNTYWNILRHQLKIVGTWNSSFYGSEDSEADKDDWHYVLERLRSGNIHPEKLISHKLEKSELKIGLDIMHEKKEEYVKVMTLW